MDVYIPGENNVHSIHMCGIVAYLGDSGFPDYIFSGLSFLQNRGYDSLGICTIKHSELVLHKSLTNSIGEFRESYTDDSSLGIAIGHTRWATHGANTVTNAHPHIDEKSRIALVHNGIIENYTEVKAGLISEGYTFQSQTDTECVSILIGKYLDEDYPIQIAIQNAVAILSGTWALVIIHRDYPDRMWITRNGSPLLLGIEDDYAMIASEQSAFGNHIKKYTVVQNHDIIEIQKPVIGKPVVVSLQSNNLSTKEYVQKSHIETMGGYDHWMMKEITEQGKCVDMAFNRGGRIMSESTVKLGGMDGFLEPLMKIRHIILLGCGTSYNAGMWSLVLFKSLEIFDTVSLYDGAEFSLRDIPRSGGSAAIFLSQSGETKDLHRCIQIAKDADLITIGVVNVVDSMIARETDCGIYLNAGKEFAVASTKSFTNQCVVLTMIAIWFAQNKGTKLGKRIQWIRDLCTLSGHIENLLQRRMDIAQLVIERSTHWYSLFLLGKGAEEGIAHEGALKLKEVVYLHAEGYSSSALKHGPFSLIVPGTPIIIFDIGEENRAKTANVIHEVMARGADVISIGDDIGCHIKIIGGTFAGILANIVVQMMAYDIAVSRGLNPDFPRNLAKVVTVE
jgi:glucosamine--fructose-6-phosphate aminotransferase (isomerizing)